MRLNDPAAGHLTYCTNVYPGETWPEVRRVLNKDVPAVRARLGAGGPFGVGLRLSAAAAQELAAPDAFAELLEVLDRHQLYVFTLNGFPYGAFHATRVKEQVYRPDWQEAARLDYTHALAHLLARLMDRQPASTPELMGTISSVPGAFRPQVAGDAGIDIMARHLLQAVGELVALERQTGRRLMLALEPEPCCYLETIAETIAFFNERLLAAAAVGDLAALMGLGPSEAEAAIRRHLGVCLDTCHAAIEFEEPLAAIAALEAAGIAIGKVQLSACLKIPRVVAETRSQLEPFADPVYLHQVVERSAAGLRRFVDLDDAFASLDESDGPPREWRVHFHVPIFHHELAPFATTQDFLATVLARHRERPITQHLEVETYTWSVLPERYRGEDVNSAVARELAWAKERLER